VEFPSSPQQRSILFFPPSARVDLYFCPHRVATRIFYACFFLKGGNPRRADNPPPLSTSPIRHSPLRQRPGSFSFPRDAIVSFPLLTNRQLLFFFLSPSGVNSLVPRLSPCVDKALFSSWGKLRSVAPPFSGKDTPLPSLFFPFFSPIPFPSAQSKFGRLPFSFHMSPSCLSLSAHKHNESPPPA